MALKLVLGKTYERGDGLRVHINSRSGECYRGSDGEHYAPNGWNLKERGLSLIKESPYENKAEEQAAVAQQTEQEIQRLARKLLLRGHDVADVFRIASLFVRTCLARDQAMQEQTFHPGEDHESTFHPGEDHELEFYLWKVQELVPLVDLVPHWKVIVKSYHKSGLTIAQTVEHIRENLKVDKAK